MGPGVVLTKDVWDGESWSLEEVGTDSRYPASAIPENVLMTWL
jgi:hypothetical protein